jgi:hypothetical protein
LHGEIVAQQLAHMRLCRFIEQAQHGKLVIQTEIVSQLENGLNPAGQLLHRIQRIVLGDILQYLLHRFDICQRVIGLLAKYSQHRDSLHLRIFLWDII